MTPPTPSPPVPVVIKVGGSLLDLANLPDQLGQLLATVRRELGAPALIAGGGEIVNEIRRLDPIHQLSAHHSHELAIRSMELTAHLLKLLLPGEPCRVLSDLSQIQHALQAQQVPIIAPWTILQQQESAHPEQALPHSWEVTSDTIAARLAAWLKAPVLILAKSVRPPLGCSLETAAELGLVDSVFPKSCAASLRVGVCNLREKDLKISWLHNGTQAVERKYKPEAPASGFLLE